MCRWSCFYASTHYVHFMFDSCSSKIAVRQDIELTVLYNNRERRRPLAMMWELNHSLTIGEEKLG